MNDILNKIMGIVNHDDRLKFVGEVIDLKEKSSTLYLASRDEMTNARELELLIRELLPRPISILSTRSGSVLMTYLDENKVYVWAFGKLNVAQDEYNSAR
jgi:hypothetical protein